MLTITKILILTSSTRSDKIYLETDLPSGVYPFEGNANLNMSVGRGMGEDYVRTNFPGIPVEIIRIG